MTRLSAVVLAPAVALFLAMARCGEDRSDPEPYNLDFDIPRSEAFSDSLSAYGLYQQPLSSLRPAAGFVNCAHCHNPGGWDEASRSDLDLRFQTPLDQTGLEPKARDLERQLETGQMPYLGTTLLHDEGVALARDYLQTL